MPNGRTDMQLRHGQVRRAIADLRRDEAGYRWQTGLRVGYAIGSGRGVILVSRQNNCSYVHVEVVMERGIARLSSYKLSLLRVVSVGRIMLLLFRA